MNRPFPSSPGPLYQNEVKCSSFDIEMIVHSRANKTDFHKKGCALGLILKVRVFGTRKWPKGNKVISYPDLLLTKPKAKSGKVRRFNFFDWPDCE